MITNLIQVGDTFGGFEHPCYYIRYLIVSPTEKNMYVEDSGEWKKVLKCFAEHNGEWKEATIFVMDNGTWKNFFY